MSSSLSLKYAVVFAALYMISPASGRPQRCSSCPSSGCPVPQGCLYGMVSDLCGRLSCAKAPGQRCTLRGFPDEAGNCGDGMYCNCNVCMGCSLHTYLCYEDTCVVPIGTG